MPPKKAVSTTGTIEPEGVPYSINLSSKIVVVGTGVVSNNERDTFRQKASPSLEEQIRARPSFAAFVAAAALAGSSSTEAPPPPLDAGSTAAHASSRQLASSSSTRPALLREMQALGITQPSAAEHGAAAAASNWPGRCSTCNMATATHTHYNTSLCDGCHPKDDHGNWLCIKCNGLTCAACERCNCTAELPFGVTLCEFCKVPYCNVQCSRRGDCREDGNAGHEKHYDYGCMTDTGMPSSDCNAPLGLGCQCACCKCLAPPMCSACVRAQSHAAWREHWAEWQNYFRRGCGDDRT